MEGDADNVWNAPDYRVRIFVRIGKVAALGLQTSGPFFFKGLIVVGTELEVNWR